MRPRHATLILRALLLPTVCGGVVTETRAGDGVETVISIKGQSGARVSGRCLVTESDGEREVRLDQAVPVEHRWRARRVRCELEAQG